MGADMELVRQFNSEVGELVLMNKDGTFLIIYCNNFIKNVFDA